MICAIPQQALNLDEKISLQKWLKEHKFACEDIEVTCNYRLSFEAHSVSAVCNVCSSRHKLLKEQ